MYLISAYFDDACAKTLQKLIDRVAAASGNTFMIDNKVPPHMTIASVETKDEKNLRSYFETLKDCISPGKINIVSPGQLFPYVMYVTPVLNEYLMGLSRDIVGMTEKIEGAKLSKYYRPYSWLPHITIGKTMSQYEMVKAFEVMQQYFVPMEATITEIGLAKTNPHEDIVRIEL